MLDLAPASTGRARSATVLLGGGTASPIILSLMTGSEIIGEEKDLLPTNDDEELEDDFARRLSRNSLSGSEKPSASGGPEDRVRRIQLFKNDK